VDAKILIGHDSAGQEVRIDLEELLATRLLVQGNSGSGKSHLLKRLLEESSEMVQQVVIDPEGDFTSLAETFNHVVIDGAAYSAGEIDALAARIREHRASVVLALEGLDVEQQIRCAARFITALFDAPREHWYPALVVVDEAQMFAPTASGEIAEETRKLSLNAMTNLMCRGRKRGLAGIVATQRLAKLAKNVAAEASNFLMGRTFLDIDMIRAADLLGMERKQAERIRDLDRGCFLGLGPAVSRRPVSVKIGPVRSGTRAAVGGLVPLPSASPEDMEVLLHSNLADAVAERPAPPPPPPIAGEPASTMEERIATASIPASPPQREPGEVAEALDEIFGEMAREDGITFQPAGPLYQNFLARCRKRKLPSGALDMAGFRRRFAIASARLDRLEVCDRKRVLSLGEQVDDDVLAPFLAIAAAAAQGYTSPDEDELARVYGTSSPGRIRRLLDHLERQGLIVVREEFGGGRTILVPGISGETVGD
jgi:energy-coupling factor transporter ATP-binding protein EcfA2